MEKVRFMSLMKTMSLAIRKYAPDFNEKENLLVWYHPFKEIPDSKLEEACSFAIENLDEFPSIAWLIRKCKGSSRSDAEIGQDIANRIETAISTYGYSNPNLAFQHLGNLGWEVVKQCGGWTNVCDIDSMSELPGLRKRWRDIATIVSKNIHERGESTAPGLPQAFKASHFLQSVKELNGA